MSQQSDPNKKLLNASTSVSTGMIYQTSAHSIGLMLENAVNTQHNQNILAQATATQAALQIYSPSEILMIDSTDNLQ